MSILSDTLPLNYYAAEESIRDQLLLNTPLKYVFGVSRLLHIPRLFERIAPSPSMQSLTIDPTQKHGAGFLFFSGLDSVDTARPDCEFSTQEWHLFVFTRYHEDEFERSIVRKINGTLTAQVMRALHDFDWLRNYYRIKGVDNTGSSKLRRVTADKLLVAETRAIEDPALAETLLAYRANFSLNWKGVQS